MFLKEKSPELSFQIAGISKEIWFLEKESYFIRTKKFIVKKYNWKFKILEPFNFKDKNAPGVDCFFHPLAGFPDEDNLNGQVCFGDVKHILKFVQTFLHRQAFLSILSPQLKCETLWKSGISTHFKVCFRIGTYNLHIKGLWRTLFNQKFRLKLVKQAKFPIKFVPFLLNRFSLHQWVLRILKNDSVKYWLIGFLLLVYHYTFPFIHK